MSKIANPDTYPSFKWVFVHLKQPPGGRLLWSIASSITLITVGLFSKIIIRVFNRTFIYNEEKFRALLLKKPVDVPIITVSNHHSCFDDPGIWGSLNYKILLNRQKMRWALAAHDICFTNTFHSYFFMLGKCIPVIRGLGVYQDSLEFMLDRLKNGEWVHIFPEGRVNMTREFIRFKWGVGRLIYDSPVTPIVVPICHLGMEEILPNEPPYVFKTGKVLTLNYGNPIDLTTILLKLRSENAHPETARKVITDKIQEEVLNLLRETKKLHFFKEI